MIQPGVLMSINGNIYANIQSEINPYEILGVVMMEQRKYMMAFMTQKINSKTNFDTYIYEQENIQKQR